MEAAEEGEAPSLAQEEKAQGQEEDQGEGEGVGQEAVHHPYPKGKALLRGR